MGLASGTCEVTGKAGILDEEAGYRCACMSPLMGIMCDGTTKVLTPKEKIQFPEIAKQLDDGGS